MVKMIALVKKRPRMSRNAFARYWLEEHTNRLLKN